MKKFMLLVLIVILVVTISSCNDYTKVENPREFNIQKYLPSNSINIKNIGNNWYTFENKNSEFLIYVCEISGAYRLIYPVISITKLRDLKK